MVFCEREEQRLQERHVEPCPLVQRELRTASAVWLTRTARPHLGRTEVKRKGRTHSKASCQRWGGREMSCRRKAAPVARQGMALQRYLAHKKPRPPRTLQ